MKNRGVTLLELLLSFFIIAVVATMLAYAFSAFRESNDLSTAHAIIIGLLRDARSRAVASDGNSVYGVHFETGKAALFKGGVYNPSDPSNETYVLPGTVEVSAINLTGGAAETIFSRLGGTTTASGTLTLSPKNNLSKTKLITIFATGNAE